MSTHVYVSRGGCELYCHSSHAVRCIYGSQHEPSGQQMWWTRDARTALEPTKHSSHVSLYTHTPAESKTKRESSGFPCSTASFRSTSMAEAASSATSFSRTLAGNPRFFVRPMLFRCRGRTSPPHLPIYLAKILRVQRETERSDCRARRWRAGRHRKPGRLSCVLGRSSVVAVESGVSQMVLWELHVVVAALEVDLGGEGSGDVSRWAQ